jgi:rhodanese-related sulfurtransferase
MSSSTTTLATFPTPISHEELIARRRERGLVLVDVLPKESYAEAHLPGAISLPLDEIPERAPMVLPDRSAEIVVYCGSLT